ncbi:MAG TPA: hypothetical protein DCM54_00765 [Gammaproteobacteria bacterium]|nr:hypothetical protein [Gammaproteobacteria bacterium]
MLRFLVLMVLILAFPSMAQDLSERQSLSPKEAAALQGKVTYLDVRTALEWLRGHVKDAIHIPHDEVAEDVAKVIPDKSVPVVAYCGSGRRAASVVESMREQGYTVVPVVNGGYSELIESGAPEG